MWLQSDDGRSWNSRDMEQLGAGQASLSLPVVPGLSIWSLLSALWPFSSEPFVGAEGFNSKEPSE